ncbi:MAG: UDP-N-acetyl-D-mannosamine dehydrogenase, partial [Cellvibrionaceae bacterium]|nr:UDP-N-acetyl-D-mannosamine dehydrogenase [Cellvibrionaceae bacterium]
DLSYIRQAAEAIAPLLSKGALVVLESTSPVGATEQLCNWLQQWRPDLSFPHLAGDDADIKIAHCPERVLPGHVLQELVSNDRVIGGISPACSAAAMQLYQLFVKGECVITNARTAEMAKLTENAFRDVNIAFANELSVLCEQLRINVWELIRLANRHPRVNILSPGPGVGGHCIAVDPWFIVHSCPEKAKLIHQARLTNDGKPQHVIEQIKRASSQFKNPVIACLGLTFKANIDDCRESPALDIVHRLIGDNSGQLIVVEPNVSAEKIDQLLPEGAEQMSAGQALEAANIVVLLVEHKEFLNLDRSRLMEKVVIDTRGII